MYFFPPGRISYILPVFFSPTYHINHIPLQLCSLKTWSGWKAMQWRRRGYWGKFKKKFIWLKKEKSHWNDFLVKSFVATWRDLEDVMLSEITQTKKDKYWMISLTCRMWNRLTEAESRMVTAGGWVEWEMGGEGQRVQSFTILRPVIYLLRVCLFVYLFNSFLDLPCVAAG